MSKKNTKSLNAEIFDSIRKPMAPASTVMKNKKDKRSLIIKKNLRNTNGLNKRTERSFKTIQKMV